MRRAENLCGAEEEMNCHEPKNNTDGRKCSTRIVVLLFTLLLLTFSVRAHDLYLMPERFFVEAGMLLQVGLHNGDTFPDSEVSPVLERVRDMRILSSSGRWDVTSLHVTDKSVKGKVRIPAGEGFIATARTIPNAFELPAPEFETYLKEEGLVQVLRWRKEHGQSNVPGSERYSKYAKALLTTGEHNEFHTRPVGFALEFVPGKSPYDLLKETNLPLRLLYNGNPVADVQVESAWAGPNGDAKTTVVGRTDGEGRIVVPLTKRGKWRIHAVLMERCKEKDIADWESSWASLTFEAH